MQTKKRQRRSAAYLFRFVVVCELALMSTLFARAQSPSEAPAYKARQKVHGAISIWGHGARGHDYIDSLMEAWEAGFSKVQPDVTFDNQLHGTASAIGALYTHKGNIALMGREIWPMEVEGFEEVFHHPPLGIDVLTGSLDVRNKEFALVVFTNKVNPIQHLSLPQLTSIFSGEKTVHTWGELGLTGKWADKPTHVYGFEIHRGFGYYMQQKIFHGSPFWNPEMTELGDVKKSDGTLLDAGQRIVDDVGSDPYAVGYSSLLYKNPDVEPIPLGATGGPFVAASRASVEDHSYPLFSVITCFIYRAPGKPVDPKLAEFFRFILSREGHDIAVRTGGYIPLTPALAAKELQKLK